MIEHKDQVNMLKIVTAPFCGSSVPRAILALLLASCTEPSTESASTPALLEVQSTVPSLHPPLPEEELAAIDQERVQWQSWQPATFATAQRLDRLVLLFLMSPWAGSDPFAHNDSPLRALVQERYVSIRVDPLRRPDIARRYGPAGWPALAVALPDGRLVATATDIPAANIHQYLLSLANHYRDRRKDVESRAEASRPASAGISAPVTAAALYADLLSEHDAVHGGFGNGAKFPETSVIRFLLAYYDHHREATALSMALRALDILIRAPMWEEGHGGVLSYSFTPDWLTPIREKDGADQAGLLQALLDARKLVDESYSDSVAGLLVYIRGQLFDSGTGAFYSRQVQRHQGGRRSDWWTDPTVYTDRNALLIMACLRAGGGEGAHGSTATDMALAAAAYLVQHCVRADGAVFHCVTENGPETLGLLDDQMLTARALWQAYQVSDREEFASASRRIVEWTDTNLYDDQERAFMDGVSDIAIPTWQSTARFSDTAVPAGNVNAAALYLSLGQHDKLASLLGDRAFDPRAPRRAYASLGNTLLRWQETMDGAPQ